MIDLSLKYKNSIDFCFKPHPALKEKLYYHKDWGISKTDNYYKFWKNGENTLLSESGYHDLFIESDSLILDSVSFTAEYLYLNKPYCFLTKDNFDYNKSLNIIGKKIFEKINKANNISSLEDFIKNSVLKSDKKQITNQKVILNNLNFLNNKNLLASQNIYNYINKTIES
jgi:CDP-glycerol glycerophosphotransferase (TagB/SpsB family)